ncbi:DinB family protein [compost metagenome]
MPEAQADEAIKLFGKFDLSKKAAFAKAFEHQAHHRGQTTVYLRLAGVKPPQEKLF